MDLNKIDRIGTCKTDLWDSKVCIIEVVTACIEQWIIFGGVYYHIGHMILRMNTLLDFLNEVSY